MNKTYKVIRFHNFKGGLHLARGRTNSYDCSLARLHSDTIKSALFVSALNLFGDKLLKENGKDFFTAFRLSSAFPFIKHKVDKGREKYSYFFPRPLVTKLPLAITENVKGGDSESVLALKELKRIKYIERGLFERLIAGNKDLSINKQQLHGGFLFTDTPAVPEIELYTTQPSQQVFIPRDMQSDSEPFFVDKVFFSKDAGLFCLLEVEDDFIWQKIKAAAKLLADSGIGTDRNTGNGHFEVDFSNGFSIKLPEQSTHQLNLSLYCPNREEITSNTLARSYYELVKRGGFIASPANLDNLTIRKRSIFMFTEGSLFPLRKLEGKVVDLRPDYPGVTHPIWRDGRALSLPFKHFEN